MAGLDAQKILRTWRLSLVCLISFFITWSFEIPNGEWALITSCVVLSEYTTVGGVLTKSYLRFAATFSSAVYCILVIYFFGNNAIVNMLAAIGGLFLYSYFFMDGKQGYIGVLGGITLTIMLFNYNNIDAAILRPFNILIGIAVSVFTLRFFYPEYARDKVLEVQADFLGGLSHMLHVFLDPLYSLDDIKKEYLIDENKLISDIAKFNRYIEEARIETQKMPAYIDHNLAAIVCEKRIYRLISVLIYHLATDEMRAHPVIQTNVKQMADYLKVLQQMLLTQTSEVKSLDAIATMGNKKSDRTVLFTETLFIEMQKEFMLLITELTAMMAMRAALQEKKKRPWFFWFRQNNI